MATLLEMKQKSTKAAMKVMAAWLEGKTVLARRLDGGAWTETRYPSWNFTHYEYQILDEEPAGNDAEEETRVA